MNRTYSTAEVAKAAGISKKTLLRWLWAGEVPEPVNTVRVGSINNRIWTLSEVDYVKAYKELHYRKRS